MHAKFLQMCSTNVLHGTFRPIIFSANMSSTINTLAAAFIVASIATMTANVVVNLLLLSQFLLVKSLS